MYSSTFVVAFLGLAAMCTANDVKLLKKESYGPHQGFQSGYGYGDPAAEAELDQLDRFLDALEAREEVQVDRIANRLEDSANANLDFKNNIVEFIAQRIYDEQHQQNKRIQDLNDKIQAIKDLRTKVDYLHEKAADIREDVKVALEERKKAMYDLNDQRNADLKRRSRIEEAQTKADNLQERIDDLVVKSCDNRIEGLELLNAAKETIDSVNRKQGDATELTLFPTNEQKNTAEVTFQNAFQGVPQFRQSGFNGIKINRKKSYYPTGYPSFYASLSETVWNDRVQFEAVDMSTGDLSVDVYLANPTYAYFSRQPIDKIH